MCVIQNKYMELALFAFQILLFTIFIKQYNSNQ